MSRFDTTDLLRSTDDLPRHEIERLLVAAVGRSRTEVLLGKAVDDEARERFEAMLARRRRGEPLQYLEGTVPFGPIEVSVDPRVLIPRPETEQLFALLTTMVEAPRLIVDLCTGSGNLALALKHSYPEAQVYATDISRDATEVAAANAAATHLDVVVLTGDLFAPLPRRLVGAVDLLVANPPYVAAHEVGFLPRDVRDHEPKAALVAGPRGDEVLARIGRDALRWLAPGGVIACEIGESQGARAAELFARYGGEVLPDLAGRDRFVVGRRDV